MMKIDLKGRRFGRLKALSEEGVNKSGHVLWRCRCDCDREVIVSGATLRNGDTKSCGCLQKDISGANFRKRVGYAAWNQIDFDESE